MLGIVSENAILDILEKLVRGTSLSEPNQGTLLFAKSVLKMYKLHGWGELVNGDYFININMVKELFTNGKINMQSLSDALGNKVLRDDAVSIKTLEVEEKN